MVALLNLARGNLHHDEDVNNREQDRMLSQKVASIDLLGVTLDESAPGLTTSWCSSAHHVFANRAGRVLDSQLDFQLLGDLVLAPFRVIGADATNQGDVVSWDRRTSGFAGTPTPISLKATPMPRDHGFRFDHNQGRAPRRPRF